MNCNYFSVQILLLNFKTSTSLPIQIFQFTNTVKNICVFYHNIFLSQYFVSKYFVWQRPHIDVWQMTFGVIHDVSWTIVTQRSCFGVQSNFCFFTKFTFFNQFWTDFCQWEWNYPWKKTWRLKKIKISKQVKRYKLFLCDDSVKAITEHKCLQ